MLFRNLFSYGRVVAMVAIVGSGFTGYQIQSDDLDEMQTQIETLELQMRDVSLQVSPPGSEGWSLSNYRTIRAFVIIPGQLIEQEPCTGLPFGAPIYLYIATDRFASGDHAGVLAAATYQGSFAWNHGYGTCAIEFLFVGAPVQTEYVFKTAHTFDVGVNSFPPINGLEWEVTDTKNWEDYAEVVLHFPG